jgi:hypothetical protein
VRARPCPRPSACGDGPRLVAAGELEAFKLSPTEGGGVRITVSSFDTLIERRLNAARRRGQDGSAAR